MMETGRGEVRIVVSHLPHAVRLGQNVVLAVDIHNETDNTISGRLVSERNGYFSRSSCVVPAVLPFSRTCVSIELYVDGHKDVSDLVHEITLRLNDKNLAGHPPSASWTLPVSIYRAEMEKYLPAIHECGAERYNILLFGMAGAGKSSFVNTIHTMLSESSRLSNLATAGGTDGHVSTALVKYELPGCRINLWDTWGLAKDNYDGSELRNMMDGVFPSHWEMDLAYDEHRGSLEANKDSRAKRRIHNVIFFLPHGSLDSPEQVELIKHNYASIRHVNPLLAVTKTDELSPRIREDPCATAPELDALRCRAAAECNIPPNRSVLAINYFSEEKKSFAVDRAALRILIKAVHVASDIASRAAKPKTRKAFDWS